MLQYVQPGLAGLMDGSVSTLAPLFAAAFATGRSWDAFLVGMAASIGAGISMGFAEALSDDGSITGRGHPWMRGLVCGLMTTLGGLGHTLPFLIPDFQVATTLGGGGGAGRAVGDRLGAGALHGHAVPAGGVPGRAGRRAGVRHRHPDRQRLSARAQAPNAEQPDWRGHSASFVLVLVLATALGPFAMQVFLPALPAIQADFGVRAATAQLAFSLSALAIAVATLFYGPLSDRFGRRPALIGGLLVYLAGSLLCAVAPTIALLIVGRIVQAAGGCAGIVLSRAIVRDLYSRDQSAAMLAYITMAMVAAPMMAPVLGGLLTDLAGWRSVFLAGVGVGVLILVAVRMALAETAPSLGEPSAHELGRAASCRCSARRRSWATRCRAPSRSPSSTPSSPPPPT